MSKKHWLVALAIWGGITGTAWAAPLEALIVDGRMNKSHDWKATSPLLRKQLEETDTMLGHGAEQLKSVAFIVTFKRGAEWAATGKVTQRVPDDFPGPDKPSVRE